MPIAQLLNVWPDVVPPLLAALWVSDGAVVKAKVSPL
nr:MAG TPA: hypothetical protein [Caudoviricetes sp.]